MSKLAGKIAVVTCGSRGIGASIAKGLGRDGATVVINYNHSQEHAEAVVEFQMWLPLVLGYCRRRC